MLVVVVCSSVTWFATAQRAPSMVRSVLVIWWSHCASRPVQHLYGARFSGRISQLPRAPCYRDDLLEAQHAYNPMACLSGVHYFYRYQPSFTVCCNTLQASYPEQINLQIASATTVVVSFVTFEEQLPVAPPTVQLIASGGGGGHHPPTTITGVAHRYTTTHATHSQFCDESSPASIQCLHRNYTMSFVKLAGLVPRQQYEYTVKSGSANALWSKPKTFRALYATGPTRVAVHGARFSAGFCTLEGAIGIHDVARLVLL